MPRLTIEQRFAPFINKLAAFVMNFRPEYFDANKERRQAYSNFCFNWRFNTSKRIESLCGTLAKLQSVFKVTQLPSFPTGNPFHHDAYQMGTYIGKDICIMYADHNPHTIDVVHMITGQRIQIAMPEPVEETVTEPIGLSLVQ